MSPSKPHFDQADVDDPLSDMAIMSSDESEGDVIPLQTSKDNDEETYESNSDHSISASRKSTLPRSRAKKARKSAHRNQQRNPPLRPAKDILSRIRHDPALDESEWIVGYNDRLEGVMEMDVSSWNSGGDFTDEEWIPQHRILYFRKRNDEPERRMWDREARLDRLFGSGVPACDQDENGLPGSDTALILKHADPKVENDG